jgi:hypothetical protein
MAVAAKFFKHSMFNANHSANFIGFKSQCHGALHTWQGNDIVQLVNDAFNAQPMNGIASS